MIRTWPVSQLADGHNKIPLANLSSLTAGQCSGSFDTIDVHVQGYACFTKNDTATSTLANLQLY